MPSDASAEMWVVIPGTEGRYDASTIGRIRSVWRKGKLRKTPAVLKGRVDRDGYIRHVLSVFDGVPEKRIAAHVLVALAFHGPRPDSHAHVAHWDGNKTNNRPSNLRYCSGSDNCADAVRQGTAPIGVRHPRAKLDPNKVQEMRRLRNETGASYKEIADRFGVRANTALYAVGGKLWGPESMKAHPKATEAGK